MKIAIAASALASAVMALVPFAALAQDDGAIWYTAGYESPETGARTEVLIFGIPETDATAVIADCRPGGGGEPEIDIMMSVDFGDRADGEPVIANVVMTGQGGAELPAAYPAVVRIESSESAGISMRARLDHPIWDTVGGVGQLAMSAMDGRKTVVPLAEDTVGKAAAFLAACYALAPPPSPAAGDVIAGTYSCENGTTMPVRFDNSGAISVAYLTPPGAGETLLAQVISGSGAKYANDGLVLHTSGDEAYFEDGQGTQTNCAMR